LQIQPFEITTMKSYYIHQEDQQRVPAASTTEKTDVTGKKWKTFLAVLALIGAAYLIIKLQQSESDKPVINQTITTPAKTPVKLKEEIRKKEPVKPISYLKVKMKWHKNLIGETVLEGTLQNTAPATNFKDPVLLVTWISKTNTTMETDRYPLYKYLGAGNTIPYKLKVKAPSKIGDVKVSVESATAIQ
jgi:hypothetical protein